MPETDVIAKRAPLTPLGCNLIGLDFMPLHFQRLWDSDFDALASDREFRIGLKLWGKSWHEGPAASLPSAETLLAKKAGVSLEEWRSLAPMALHGWVLCADGRYYHPVVAKLALDAWIGRIGHQKRGAAGNAKQAGIAFDAAPFDAMKLQAEQFLRALDAEAQSTSPPLRDHKPIPKGSQTDPLAHPLADPKPPQGTVKGRDSEEEGQRRDSENSYFNIDDGWALDAAALEDGIAVGLSKSELEAAAEQHLAWWRANQPNAKKTRDGWALAWRTRLDDVVEDPDKRSRLKRTAKAVSTPRKAPSPPEAGAAPDWWIVAAKRLAEEHPKTWLDVWSGCSAQTEMGVLVAGTGHAAKEINSGQPGAEARRLLGFEIRAIDPIDAPRAKRSA